MKKTLLATMALAAMSATCAFGSSYQEKQSQIQNASTKALQMLTTHRDEGTLNDENALVIIKEEISPQFDFGYLTQYVVGKHWRKATDSEKGDLTQLFRDLVERTYSKSFAKFKDQEIDFMEPEELKDGSVNVGVNVLNQGKNIRIEYLLKEHDENWVVTDVKIENVSLLGNFRRQFNTIIRKDGISGLIDMLRSKT